MPGSYLLVDDVLGYIRAITAGNLGQGDSWPETYMGSLRAFCLLSENAGIIDYAMTDGKPLPNDVVCQKAEMTAQCYTHNMNLALEDHEHYASMVIKVLRSFAINTTYIYKFLFKDVSRCKNAACRTPFSVAILPPTQADSPSARLRGPLSCTSRRTIRCCFAQKRPSDVQQRI